ncbi:EFR1 family ferrodoxin [Carboxylicivirga linearis]|uniref:EFR1 family ferrodoxin n=1 Tax=Carboxylicivirga linearis TaxID=1628157 RepID=A0ABS5JUX6_9BACT|nr:EFR1 family ferrodoxin [Carboxylicivirga linearis]MBS2098648.1 EFR1 family ferrodoxin [Carboxylicivirga linearis]
MNTALYYFSGTGNSLSVARSINNQLEGSELLPIVGCLKQKPIKVNAQRVGIIFPLHFMTVPRIVREFLKEAQFVNAEYIFAVVTGLNPKIGNALSQIEKYLNKAGVKFNAGYFIPMVAAHFPYVKLSKIKEPQKLYQEAQDKVLKISESILQLKNEFDKEAAVFGDLKLLVSKKQEHKESFLSVGEGCIRCGYCMQVCPFQNIRLNGKQVEWLDNCHQCLACLHFCSRSVIEYKKLSIGKPRKHHPSVSLNDIALQRQIP